MGFKNSDKKHTGKGSKKDTHGTPASSNSNYSIGDPQCEKVIKVSDTFRPPLFEEEIPKNGDRKNGKPAKR